MAQSEVGPSQKSKMTNQSTSQSPNLTKEVVENAWEGAAVLAVEVADLEVENV